MKIEETKTDPKLREEGVWIPFKEGAEFLIASSERKKYKDKLGRLQMKASRSGRRDLTMSETQETTAKALPGTVLLDWKGIENNDGSPCPYSDEVAEKWLADSDELRMFVLLEASDIRNFQTKKGEPEAETPLAQTKSGPTVPSGTG